MIDTVAVLTSFIPRKLESGVFWSDGLQQIEQLYCNIAAVYIIVRLDDLKNKGYTKERWK